ncbi:MAG: hypothetical protein ACFFAE_21480, partial [Candidatus Hodarchaeota archaeon]
TGFITFIVAAPSESQSVDYNDYYSAVDWQSGLAGKLAMPEYSGEPLQMPSGARSSLQTSSALQTADAYVGQQVYDWYLWAINYYYGAANGPYMTCRAISEYAEVWVADDLFFLPGDPRNDYPDNWTITDEMCQHLAEEVDEVIYPICSEYFGMSLDRDGTGNVFGYDWPITDNPQRIMIKILNIIDDAYFDPDYPYFAIGFFSSGYTAYYDRNLIHLDSWQWWRRLGETGTEWIPGLFVEEAKEFNYESTTAHEYQHLIHRDYQSAPEAWMNEGCSMYSEFLCGYGLSVDHVNAYFTTPDNSLTVWGDQGDINILADYGASALWTMYLSDHFGGADIIRQYVQSGITGIEGVNAALAHYGYKKDFYDIYHDWRLANLIRSDFPGCRKYNYKSVDLTEFDPIRIYEESGLPVPEKRGLDYGSTITEEDIDTGVFMVGPFGSDYIEFSDWKKLGKLSFNGDEYSYLGWQPVEDGFWSAFGDEQDKWLTAEAYVDPGDPVLELVTKYNIEAYWDFGFVQAYNETSGEWVSLENAYTTYLHWADAYPDIIEELPGLTGASPGWPDEWTTMSFDLSYWADQTVQLVFRYMTDWATTEDGWFIKEASVSGTPLTLVYETIEASFMVSVVRVIETRKHTIYIPWDMKLDDETNEGSRLLYTGKSLKIILVVSPTMLGGFTDYSIKAERFKICKWH